QIALLALSHQPRQLHHDRLQPERRRGLHQSLRAADYRSARGAAWRRGGGHERGRTAGKSSMTETGDYGGQKMGGRRFERGPDASFYEFERSWKFDRRLLPQEIALDRAWARAIAAAGILTDDECKQIVAALDEIELRAKTDAVWLDTSKAEDVHHFAETALIEKLGPLGAKLHPGRSRNEMVATEFRMYVKDAARDVRGALALLLRAIADQSGRNLGIPMPGTTHMQHAQPLL